MKKNIVFLLVAVLVFAIVLGGCANTGNNPPQGTENGGSTDKLTGIEKIKNSGKLVMGTSADYPPFEFHAMIDGKDVISGLDVEIAKYIAADLGVDLEIKDMDFGNLLGAVSTEMIDIIVAGMNPTEERMEDANFTDIYYEADIAVLVKKESANYYNTEDDLKGKIIGVQIGTTQEEIAGGYEGAEVKSFGSNSDAIMNLITGKVDCVLMESVVTDAYAKVNDDIVVAEKIIIKNLADGTAIATQKGNDELTEYMNGLIKEMAEKGLIEKWFQEAQALSEEGIE